MPILSDGTVAIEAQGGTTELTGILTAFKNREGWWAAIIVPADAVPAGDALVGRPARIKAAEGSATVQVSACVSLRSAVPSVQLLMRGQGDSPFS